MGRSLAMLLAVFAGCSTLPDHPPLRADPESLAAAEIAFAAQSVREGMRAAFLAWLAPDATIYRDAPVNGLAFIAANPDPPVVLDWRPVFVEVAASGEMGFSTGPWTLRSRRDPAAPLRHGQFVSIWKRDAHGSWRVGVDLGISHPGPVLADTPLQAATTSASSTKASATVADAEARFAGLAARAGNASAYGEMASPSIRLYRDGYAPFLGRSSVLASPAARDSGTNWKPETHEVSASGDLGYALGSYGPAASGAIAGYYVRVWRREADGWRIALDVVNALPPR